MDRPSRSLSRSSSHHPSTVGASALRLASPFRLRQRRDPADAIDSYSTLDVGPLTVDDSLAALHVAAHPLESIVIVDARRTFGGRAESMSRGMASLFERQGLSRSLVVDDSTLRQLAQRAVRRLTLARIRGPVDVSDVLALEKSIRSGSRAFDAELRATSVAQIARMHCASVGVWAQFRSDEAARCFLGVSFARWIGRLLGIALPVPSDRVVRVALPASCMIRTPDIRDADGMLDITLRTPRGRIAARVSLDRATGCWYA